MANPQWKGVYPALLTPFHADESLDGVLFVKNLRAQIDAGVDGVIIGGSLGEASTLLNEEKIQLLQIAKKEAGQEFPVLVNIAESTTKAAVAFAKEATAAGADGFMLLPPMRYKSDDAETVAYFKAVANATSQSIMIYNNPVDYKIEVTLDMFASLAECENIQAVKESTRDVSNVTRMKNRFGDRFKILCGVDTLALEELCLGADGWIAGLVDAFPRETVAIYRLIKAGRLAEALSIYRWFLPVLELDIHPKLVQYIKVAATLTDIGSPHVRAPRLPLQGAELSRVTKIVEDALATRPVLPDYLSINS